MQYFPKRAHPAQAGRGKRHAEVLKALSPHRREHITRLGDYLLDVQRRVLPLEPAIDFSFKSAA